MGKHKPYIRFSEEEIEQARKMDILDVIQRMRGYSFEQVGNEYRCREHNSLVVQADRQKWYWNSQDLKGYGAISWLMRVEGYDFPTAVATLLNRQPEQQTFASIQPFKQSGEKAGNSFEIYRLRDDSYNDKIKGLSLSQLQNAGFEKPEYQRYRRIYNGNFDNLKIKGTLAEKLRGVYSLFNTSPPEDYKGAAITTSDIITIDKNSYYVDIDGFKPIKDFKSFGLPIQWKGKYENVYQYLTETRCIAPSIVTYCFKQHIIYQDVRRNCVFVGYDDEGKARFASQRSTYQGARYRPDVPFSDKSYSFNISPASESDRVFVFESPIDLLSHATLSLMLSFKHCQETGKQYDPDFWLKHNRMSLSGTAYEAALGSYLSRHPKIRKIACCLDNDEAGQTTAQKIKEYFEPKGYLVTVHHSATGKDYNDTLVSLVNDSKQQTSQSIDLSVIFNSKTIRR